MFPAISLSTHSTLPTNLTVTSRAKPPKPQNPLNKTIESLCKSGKLDQAIRLLESKSPVDPETYAFLLHSCISHKSSDHGRKLYLHLLLSKDETLLRDYVIREKLITLFSVCGHLDEARHVFDECLLDEEDLPESVWVAMAIGYSRNGCFMEALVLYVEMLWRGVVPGNFSFSMALKACSGLDDLQVGRGVHAQVVKSGNVVDQVVYNALLGLYAQCGCFEEVIKVFNEMPMRNVVSWNSLIGGFVNEGQLFKALDVLGEMQREGIGFSWITLTTVLPVCGQVAMLNYGKEIHAQIIKARKRPDLLVMNSLVDMYVKCGMVDFGRRVFDGIKTKDLTSWNTMITGYAINGLMKEAMCLFDVMVSNGVRPDGVSFIALLSGCSHAGLVEDGQKLFHKMEMDFGVSPSLEHYACMVDILGRGGRIDEAMEVVKNMPMEPSGSIWGSLLNSCRLHGEVSFGEVVAKRLFKLEPNNPGNYVLLSNIYANAGMWDRVNEVRDIMLRKGIKKEAGCSWVQIKDKVSTFVAGGGFEFRNSPAYKQTWNKLSEAMEEMGYVPDTGVVLHDVNEEMKAIWVCGHSERLAMIYSLMHTADGMPIRITKNLRVCADCHKWIKIVSKVTGRVIVLRDTTRFHHFKQGACTCKDYW